MASTGPTRRWPAVAILTGAAIAIAIVRALNAHDRQLANLLTAFVALIATVALAAWLLLFARLPRRTRAAVGIAAFALFGIGLATVRVAGVTGDLVPILAWRWSAPTTLTDPAASVDATVALPGLADFPQFFGPQRDGRSPGPELADDWQTAAPRELWRRPIGAGWSGFATAGRVAITQEQHADDEIVRAYDIATGAVLWTHRDRARHDSALGGLGPRATPTIDGALVFTQGATGILNCLDLATGRRVWTRDVVAENGASTPEWGVAGSPLVLDANVIVSAGGRDHRSLVAYRKEDGAPVWQAGTDAAHYSSPVDATLANQRQVLIFNASGVAAHRATDGVVAWTYAWKTGHPHVCMPVPLDGDRVLISSGYGTGAELIRIEHRDDGQWTATREWKSLAMKAKFANLIVHDGSVFGLDDGILACVDLATGRRRWKSGRYGHGQLLRVGGHLLVTTETGEIVLLDASPDAARERARLRVFDGKTWNPPALAGAYLLVRTDAEAACYRLPLAGD